MFSSRVKVQNLANVENIAAIMVNERFYKNSLAKYKISQIS